MSEIKDKFYDWELMPVSHIIYLMVKWFGFDRVHMTCSERASVESGVWFIVEIERDEPRLTYSVYAQRPDILKRRLIEFLDERKTREDYLKEKVRSGGDNLTK